MAVIWRFYCRLDLYCPVDGLFQVILNGVEVAVLDWTTTSWSVNLPKHKMVEVSYVSISLYSRNVT